MSTIETPASAREFIARRNRAMDARRRRTWCCRIFGDRLGLEIFNLFTQ